MTHLTENFFCYMFKIRFYISVAIYAAVSVILPFLIPLPAKMYLVLIGIFTVGYLIPSVLSVKKDLIMAILIWFVGGIMGLVMYDYQKSINNESHVFLQNWQKFYIGGILIFLGLQFYARFTAELVVKQLTKK